MRDEPPPAARGDRVSLPSTSDGRAETPRRQVAAWCLFDFANSSYTTLIVTVVFAVYFREVVVDAVP